jgi:hypothetical protein
MAVNLNPTQGAAAPTGGRLDRHDAEARQGRWMLELERAMFSTSAKTARGAAARREGGGPAPQDVLAQNGADAMSTPAPRRVTGMAARAPADRHVDGAQSGAGYGVRSVDAQPGHDQPAESNLAGPHAGEQGAAAAVVPVRERASAGTPAGTTFAAPKDTAVVAPAVAAAVVPVRERVSAGTPAGDDAVSPLRTVQALRQAAPPLAPCPQPAAPQADSSVPDGPGPDAAEQPDAGAAPTADAAEFDKRLMHLFSGPDGMHAYIRDAELGAAQMRSVAAALSTELAAGGRSLTTLTVNGKRIDLTDRDAADGAEPTGSLTYPHSLSLARKEPTE